MLLITTVLIFPIARLIYCFAVIYYKVITKYKIYKDSKIPTPNFSKFCEVNICKNCNEVVQEIKGVCQECGKVLLTKKEVGRWAIKHCCYFYSIPLAESRIWHPKDLTSMTKPCKKYISRVK